MVDNPTSPLRNLIGAAQDEMALRLRRARASFTHPGDKGTSVEAAFKSFLEQYLPRNLSVGSGEVIDSKGNRSKQTDIVVISDDHPLIFPLDQPGLFFIEGVRAAGEVKSVLTAKNLADTTASSHQFKLLQSEPGKNTQVHAAPSSVRRYGRNAPYFLIAMESQISRERIAEVLTDTVTKNPEFTNCMFDAILVLNVGLWINMMDGQEPFSIIDTEGKPATGWTLICNENLLFDFMAWLSSSMLKFQRYEPMLPTYMIPMASLADMREEVNPPL